MVSSHKRAKPSKIKIKVPLNKKYSRDSSKKASPIPSKASNIFLGSKSNTDSLKSTVKIKNSDIKESKIYRSPSNNSLAASTVTLSVSPSQASYLLPSYHPDNLYKHIHLKQPSKQEIITITKRHSNNCASKHSQLSDKSPIKLASHSSNKTLKNSNHSTPSSRQQINSMKSNDSKSKSRVTIVNERDYRSVSGASTISYYDSCNKPPNANVSEIEIVFPKGSLSNNKNIEKISSLICRIIKSDHTDGRDSEEQKRKMICRLQQILKDMEDLAARNSLHSSNMAVCDSDVLEYDEDLSRERMLCSRSTSSKPPARQCYVVDNSIKDDCCIEHVDSSKVKPLKMKSSLMQNKRESAIFSEISSSSTLEGNAFWSFVPNDIPMNQKLNSSSLELTYRGFLYLLRYIEKLCLKKCVYTRDFYRTVAPNLATKNHIIGAANCKRPIDKYHSVAVTMVLLCHMQSLIRRSRNSIEPCLKKLWIRIFHHLLILYRTSSICNETIVKSFVPMLIHPTSIKYNQAISILMMLLDNYDIKKSISIVSRQMQTLGATSRNVDSCAFGADDDVDDDVMPMNGVKKPQFCMSLLLLVVKRSRNNFLISKYFNLKILKASSRLDGMGGKRRKFGPSRISFKDEVTIRNWSRQDQCGCCDRRCLDREHLDVHHSYNDNNNIRISRDGMPMTFNYYETESDDGDVDGDDEVDDKQDEEDEEGEDDKDEIRQNDGLTSDSNGNVGHNDIYNDADNDEDDKNDDDMDVEADIERNYKNMNDKISVGKHNKKLKNSQSKTGNKYISDEENLYRVDIENNNYDKKPNERVKDDSKNKLETNREDNNSASAKQRKSKNRQNSNVLPDASNSSTLSNNKNKLKNIKGDYKSESENADRSSAPVRNAFNSSDVETVRDVPTTEQASKKISKRPKIEEKKIRTNLNEVIDSKLESSSSSGNKLQSRPPSNPPTPHLKPSSSSPPKPPTSSSLSPTLPALVPSRPKISSFSPLPSSSTNQKADGILTGGSDDVDINASRDLLQSSKSLGASSVMGDITSLSQTEAYRKILSESLRSSQDGKLDGEHEGDVDDDDIEKQFKNLSINSTYVINEAAVFDEKVGKFNLPNTTANTPYNTLNTVNSTSPNKSPSILNLDFILQVFRKPAENIKERRLMTTIRGHEKKQS
ncbi:hypothetical protein HELRODRAFT_175170 [Helobdella robusta]|uniref:Uncharacterized protein n=1 Tax=Helobdella robusta TaxID=6412 RepID=T1F8Y6_HELRO|nr:hypothetical protein HELRODRAFT_175170 [Helobdella robusta]ESO01141.1 hypothetical protein HELRODRAFT_175170 [Helobdella robusta]